MDDNQNDENTKDDIANGAATVTIYSTPVCHFCHAAKDFFKEKNVEFTDYDVASDAEKRQEMIDLTGQMGVPVIKIGDDIVIGFDEPKIKELLSI
jgi:glutaredoxin 3